MPMEPGDVRAIVERELPRMARMLRVDHWRITAVYDGSRLTDGHVAECGCDVPYERATLYFHPYKHDDEADVIDSLRHELIHVALSPFEMLWTAYVKPLDGTAREQAGELWKFACERGVLAIERILDGMTPRDDARISAVQVPPHAASPDAPDAIC